MHNILPLKRLICKQKKVIQNEKTKIKQTVFRVRIMMCVCVHVSHHLIKSDSNLLKKYEKWTNFRDFLP